jgi:hypothetical protein
MTPDYRQLSDEDLLDLVLYDKIEVQDIPPARMTRSFILEGSRQLQRFTKKLTPEQFTPEVQTIEIEHLLKSLSFVELATLPEKAGYAVVARLYLKRFSDNIHEIHPSYLTDDDIQTAILKNPDLVKLHNPALFVAALTPALANQLIEHDIAKIDMVDPWVITDESLKAGIHKRPLRLPHFGKGEAFRRLMALLKTGYWPDPDNNIWITYHKPRTVAEAVKNRLADHNQLADITLLDAYLCIQPLTSLKLHVSNNELLLRLMPWYPKEEVLSTFKENLVVVGDVFKADLGL